jgi:hypothetical protein
VYVGVTSKRFVAQEPEKRPPPPGPGTYETAKPPKVHQGQLKKVVATRGVVRVRGRRGGEGEGRRGGQEQCVPAARKVLLSFRLVPRTFLSHLTRPFLSFLSFFFLPGADERLPVRNRAIQ